MKINRLYFEDFGILRNQAMEGIAGSPVVIAGPNRAGKTTIATALRYLAYGFPRQGAGLPSFVTQHRVEADVETADSFSYNISLKGHGSPDIRPLGRNNSRDLPQLYGEIDAFTYRQVFSISLDELKQVPEGLADRELENLQVLLLGGGWSDILRLEQIRAGLEKEYNVIGGKHGKIHVKQFGPYGGKVSEGQDELQEARKELESFYRQKDRLIEINNNMPCLVNDKKVLQNKVDRLEVIKEHFQHYRRMQELEKGLSQHEHQQLLENFPANAEQRAAELYREYEEAQAALEKAKKDLTLAAGFTNDREALQIALLNSGAKLDEFQLKLSGWRERITALKRGRAENSGEKSSLKKLSAS